MAEGLVGGADGAHGVLYLAEAGQVPSVAVSRVARTRADSGIA